MSGESARIRAQLSTYDAGARPVRPAWRCSGVNSLRRPDGAPAAVLVACSQNAWAASNRSVGTSAKMLDQAMSRLTPRRVPRRPCRRACAHRRPTAGGNHRCRRRHPARTQGVRPTNRRRRPTRRRAETTARRASGGHGDGGPPSRAGTSRARHRSPRRAASSVRRCGPVVDTQSVAPAAAVGSAARQPSAVSFCAAEASPIRSSNVADVHAPMAWTKCRMQRVAERRTPQHFLSGWRQRLPDQLLQPRGNPVQPCLCVLDPVGQGREPRRGALRHGAEIPGVLDELRCTSEREPAGSTGKSERDGTS